MSLSSYNAPANAVSTGVAWSPPVNNHQNHNHAAGESCGSGLPSGLVAPTTGNSTTRGGLTGDSCLTIDMYCNSNMLSAVWSEEKIQCTLINDKTQAILNLSKHAIDQLSQNMFNTGKLDPEEMLVGRKENNEHEMETFYPLTELNNYDPLTKENSQVSLEALVAPLLLFAEQSASSKIQPIQSSSDETKPKKSKKVKKAKKTISLIVPCGYEQNQSAVLLYATAMCEYQIKNMINRGVATIAGALYRSPREKSGNITANKQDLGFTLSDYCTNNAGVDPIVFYFRVYSLPPRNNVLYFDAALVRCEGSADAKEIGNMLGYERLCTLATAGGLLTRSLTECGLDSTFDSNSSKACGSLMTEILKQLLTSSKATKDQISAICTEGILTTDSTASYNSQDVSSILESLGVPKGTAVTKAQAQDAVIGGCLLTAAELDSSKQYIQIEDVWKIAHMLPIADGILQSVDIGVDIQWTERASGDSVRGEEDVETLFTRDTRTWKADIGPVKPTYNTNPAGAVVKKELKWGSIYFSLGKNPHGHKPVKGYPRVHILQRRVSAMEGGAKGDWTVIKTITPLVAKDRTNRYLDSLEPVEKCDLLISINPSTGVVEYSECQGRSVREIKTSHRSWFMLALLLLSPFIIYGLLVLYGILHEKYTTYRHVQWLTDFYLKNAPEKLKLDSQLIERTIRKYEGRMFLLWRGLEKTYKVKWTPPFSIVEDTGPGIEL